VFNLRPAKAGKTNSNYTQSMFSDNITLHPDEGPTALGANVDDVYNLRNLDNGNSERVLVGSFLGAPRTLKISHESSKPNSDGIITDRHLVRVDYTIAADGSTPALPGYCYIVIGVPRHGDFHINDVGNMVGGCISFFKETSVLAKLVAGES
jgi:hypothetical protein